MITDERYEELLAYAKRTYHYMTERERQRIMFKDYGKAPVEIPIAEAVRRGAAMQADRLKNGPQTPEEETIHAHMLRGLVEEIADRLDQHAQRNEKAAHEVRKRTRLLRRIAPAGGKATAHYTDAIVTDAFVNFKHKNSGKTIWDAANHLIRKGNPLDKFKGPTGPLNRATRIAQKNFGISLQRWFAEL